MSGYHLPIMRNKVAEGLALKEGGIYFDGTAGGGGHSRAILEGGKHIRLIATDKDLDAIAEADRQLREFSGRYALYHSDFKNFSEVFAQANVEKIDGFLLDLGISSHQIDDEKRGFAYRLKNAPLDMRMDQSKPFSAKDVVNTYSEERLRFLFRAYGEEKFAGAVARNIVRSREKKPVETCGEFEKLVTDCIPVRFRNPASAKKCFQAVRIEVNGELTGLGECLKGLVRRLKIGGRGCVLTFHSLEDRIVKQTFKELSEGCVCPKELPVCVCGRKAQIRQIGRYTADEEEIRENSRSKSAKLRIVEKIAE